MSKLPLPIDPLIPQIVERIQTSTISILQAEPGAGKTTRVPPALLDRFPGQIYVLEPRRLAARLAARRVADEMSQRLGDTVGYQVRFEQVGGSQTRLWYLTEGVLTRKLISDRQLRSPSVVILDEFHERHLETDLALALLRNLQRSQPDLRLLLMSATLQGEELAGRLGGAAVIKAPGRVFPVSVRYKPHSSEALELQVAAAVSELASETKGHILVFLPGATEIRRAVQACESMARRLGERVLPLHGDLPPEQQDEAISPSSARKIICSTNVAESSVTIDGVEAVVDSGLARVPAHSAWSGLTRLEVQKISQSSAVQRTGRAGRTQPGIAIRLYPESDFVRRPKDLSPEIVRSDLAPFLLQLASAGIAWDELTLLDAPPPELLLQADVVLKRLGALDEESRITDIGRRMAAIAVHPRLARFMMAAAELGGRHEACELATRLSGGRFRLNPEASGRHSSDLEQILASDLDYATRRLRDQLLSSTSAIRAKTKDPQALEKALLLAYSDRVARRRGETLLLSDGSSARLHSASSASSEFLIAIEVEGSLVRLTSSIEPDWLLEYFPDRVETRDELLWNRENERVEQVSSLRYENLPIDETRSNPPDGAAAASDMLIEKAFEAGLERFADAEKLNSFLKRVRFVQRHAPELDIPVDLAASALRQLALASRVFANCAMRPGMVAYLPSSNQTCPCDLSMKSPQLT